MLTVFLCACGGESRDVASYSNTQPVTDASIKSTLSEILDSYFASADIKEADAGFALIVKEHDKVVYEKFSGLANKNKNLL